MSATKGKAEEAVKALDFQRTIIYRPGLLITSREESRLLDKTAQCIVGFLDRSSKTSIKTEVLAKAMVFNATKKSIADAGKSEILEHAEILKVSKEADPETKDAPTTVPIFIGQNHTYLFTFSGPSYQKIK